MSTRKSNHFKYAVQIAQNVVVPESQDPVASALQPLCASPIRMKVRRTRVLPPIEFDNKFGVMTDEIDDVAAYHGLSPETCAAKSMCAQPVPKSLLCLTHTAAQPTCGGQIATLDFEMRQRLFGRVCPPP
jgi:hypothetical protein